MCAIDSLAEGVNEPFGVREEGILLPPFNDISMPVEGRSVHLEEEMVEDDAGAAQASQNRAAEPVRRNAFRAALMIYTKRLRGGGGIGLPLFTPSYDVVPTFVFSTSIMLVLAAIDVFALEPYALQAYFPMFGASCALTTCLITSSGAQPRCLFLTHFVGALLGLSFGHVTKSLEQPLGRLLAGVFAVGVLSPLTTLFGGFQPSSSATAVLAAFHEYGRMNDEGFMFLVVPVILGVFIIFILSWVANNLIPWRTAYPLWW
ncbi:HPP protein [Trypanosoma melophagium]|uniref:HPP protein n=1 Tax=Trypanosoma melophagium TaxID=715481 RepID=UPI00351A4EB2|nr:HPP protein [Trypanosoma melophagium]